MTSTFGKIDAFDDSQGETWEHYTERLGQYFVANGIGNEEPRDKEKRRAILLSVCGAKVYKLMSDLSAPTKPSEKTYEDLVVLVKEHSAPKPSEIVQRYKFHNRFRKTGESVSQYIAALRNLSEHCNFGGTLETMIRDRLVCGINDDRIQRRLLSERELTFTKSYEIAISMETAAKNVVDLQQDTTPAGAEKIHKVSQPKRGQQRPKSQQQTQGHRAQAPDNQGAFLIPYVIFLVLCGIPLFFLEVSYGQFASLSPITVWRICPLFKGVGYGMVIISGIVCIYYNIIITWTIYYLYYSFRAVLPWSTCDNWWNTDKCFLRTKDSEKNTTSVTLSNETRSSNTSWAYNVSMATPLMADNDTKTASEEFWQRAVLQLSDGIDDMGDLRWDLLICLFVAWVIVFLCLFKGVKSSGKVVYVTATFPYLVLLILLVRGVTLPGAGDGIYFYLVPDWEKLATFEVWGDAAVQIFYSVGMAWGGLITMASYNKFHNNVYRDAMVVPLINCGTSVFAGLVIFSVLGFMAHETGVDIGKVVTQGPGLTFVAYPEAVAKLPISPLWAVLFFLMLFTIGLDSQVTFLVFFTVLALSILMFSDTVL